MQRRAGGQAAAPWTRAPAARACRPSAGKKAQLGGGSPAAQGCSRNGGTRQCASTTAPVPDHAGLSTTQCPTSEQAHGGWGNAPSGPAAAPHVKAPQVGLELASQDLQRSALARAVGSHQAQYLARARHGQPAGRWRGWRRGRRLGRQPGKLARPSQAKLAPALPAAGQPEGVARRARGHGRCSSRPLLLWSGCAGPAGMRQHSAASAAAHPRLPTSQCGWAGRDLRCHQCRAAGAAGNRPPARSMDRGRPPGPSAGMRPSCAA